MDEGQTGGAEAARILDELGIEARGATGLPCPIDGSAMPGVTTTDEGAAAASIECSCTAFQTWRTVPAPRRGELVRLFGNLLRQEKARLGRLVCIETGKPISEALGEVQEMIDICDFAVGLSRQLYGLTIASERPLHHMREAWHPL